MGKLYDIIQRHIDAQQYGVSQRKVAHDIGVTQTAMDNWKTPKKLIAKKHLARIALVTGTPYREVLAALMDDIGYSDPDDIYVSEAAYDPDSDDSDEPGNGR